MDDRSRSIASRAALAAALTVGFYLLALAVVAALLYVPYAEWRYAGRIHLKIVLLCLGGAFAVAASLLPPKEAGAPDGPELRREKHPRLFAEVDAVALATGQSPPDAVLLVPDVNAWVSEYPRDGRRSRVMGVGLPLLSVLDVAQLRAVLAHEFGHYYGGDTKLGPWLYRTRQAIGRTVRSLEEKGHSLLQWPFRKYGELFLRTTQKVSRLQEYRADELAARHAGPEALASSLRTIAGGGAAFDLYWRNEVAPVLAEGFVPPLLEGFTEYVRKPRIEEFLARYVEERERDGGEELYDSHPSLKNRLEALGKMPAKAGKGSGVPALSLLSDVEGLERELVDHLARGWGEGAPTARLGWDEAGRVAYLKKYRQAVEEAGGALSGVEPAAFPALLAEPAPFLEKVRAEMGGVPDGEDVERYAAFLLGALLAVRLADRGWELFNEVGAGMRAVKGDESLDPFAAVEELRDGKRTGEDWTAFCLGAGL